MTSLFALSETGKPNTTGFLERGAWNKDCAEREKRLSSRVGSKHETTECARFKCQEGEREREETQTGEVGEKVLSSLQRPGILGCFCERGLLVCTQLASL